MPWSCTRVLRSRTLSPSRLRFRRLQVGMDSPVRGGVNLLLLLIFPAARPAHTSASPPLPPASSPQPHQTHAARAVVQEHCRSTVLPLTSLTSFTSAPTALRMEFKTLNRANKTVYWLGPASAHPIFNSPAIRPAWSPHQVEKERRALWVAGTVHSYEGVCTFREVGMGQKG